MIDSGVSMNTDDDDKDDVKDDNAGTVRKDSGIISDTDDDGDTDIEDTCAAIEDTEDVAKKLKMAGGNDPVINGVIDNVVDYDDDSSPYVRYVAGVDGPSGVLSFVFVKDMVMALRLNRRKDQFYVVEQMVLQDCDWVKRLRTLRSRGSRVFRPLRTTRGFKEVAAVAVAHIRKS